ncbi:MAG: GNAT family N-acetyltransferase [Flavobacteriales bacterium]
MKIEKSIQTDSKKLTELTIRSKSHWDYCMQQIEKWRDDLTVSEDYIIEKEVYKLIDSKDKIIGYYSFFKIDEVNVKLENLFVEPKFIGYGYGKMLMNDFIERIRKTRTEKIILDSDPNAENFYAKNGFKVVGKLKTSIEGRFLPIMELKI